MKEGFYQLADHLTQQLRGTEIHTCEFSGEDSDFVRINKSAVRQPGHVAERHLTLTLIEGLRHSSGAITLSGNEGTDRERTEDLLAELRDRIPHLPEDPHLLYSKEVRSSEKDQPDRLPDPEEVIQTVLDAGKGHDFVGIYASGGVYRGFANSLGQRNWFSSYSFNVDWSLYHEGDKAVKTAYAGFEWEPDAFQHKVSEGLKQLSILGRASRTIDPGEYRVYLTPVALSSILETLAWMAFGIKAARTKQTPLLRMIEGEAQLSPLLSIRENTAGGVSPNFQSEGFIKPGKVDLIQKGQSVGSLISPRSAKEYGVPTNGASGFEMPVSPEMDPGSLPTEKALSELGTGLCISNLWYLNYSDVPAGRITGMTRFATFWVENGEIQAPLNVMRFDDTIYRMLGENLLDLTSESELILDPETYGGRSTSSIRLPGALIKDFRFTL